MEEYKQYKTEALREIARKLGIRGYYNNSKPKLIELIIKHKKLQENDFKVDKPTISVVNGDEENSEDSDTDDGMVEKEKKPRPKEKQVQKKEVIN